MLSLLPLAALAAAAPALVQRAGGPAAVPIPSTCNLVSLHPDGTTQTTQGGQYSVLASSDVAAADGFSPSEAVRAANTAYSYFLTDSGAGWNETASLQECLEQCHGFGGPCAGVAWGHNVQGEAYGAAVTGVACLFMSTELSQPDLVHVTNGSWTQAVAVNIECPSS